MGNFIKVEMWQGAVKAPQKVWCILNKNYVRYVQEMNGDVTVWYDGGVQGIEIVKIAETMDNFLGKLNGELK